jgi:hypothetical protein
MNHRIAWVMTPCVVTLLAVLVARLALAQEDPKGPNDKPPKEAAYPHVIRVRVVEATPLEPIAGLQPFELRVERFYGKITQESLRSAKKHETQQFTIQFPATRDAVIKPGDVIDYEITRYLSRSGTAADSRPTAPRQGGRAGNEPPPAEPQSIERPSIELGEPTNARPRQPGGQLRAPLGEYRTIEGVLAVGGKVETGTLLVDTVEGRKLDQPVRVLVHNLRNLLPPNQRCVLKGYETGAMIGVPPAALAAAEEQGRTDVYPSPVEFQWRPYFVALIVIEPEGLELPRE